MSFTVMVVSLFGGALTIYLMWRVICIAITIYNVIKYYRLISGVIAAGLVGYGGYSVGSGGTPTSTELQAQEKDTPTKIFEMFFPKEQPKKVEPPKETKKQPEVKKPAPEVKKQPEAKKLTEQEIIAQFAAKRAERESREKTLTPTNGVWDAGTQIRNLPAHVFYGGMALFVFLCAVCAYCLRPSPITVMPPMPFYPSPCEHLGTTTCPNCGHTDNTDNFQKQ